jgi:hypothetical protein
MDTKLVLTIVVSRVDSRRLVHKLPRTTISSHLFIVFLDGHQKTEECIPKSQAI